MNEIQQLVDGYYAWLKDKTKLKQIGSDWVEVTTPQLDRHNDYLQIYIRKEGNGYVLTDDGYVINDLLDSGCVFTKGSNRLALLRSTLDSFGISEHENRLSLKATAQNFPMQKNNLLQAMLVVNDMFYTAKPHKSSLFIEDVMQWFDLSSVRYIRDFDFTGKSGYNNHFDFVIPKSKSYSERIVQAVANPDRNMVESLVFRWQDTKERRPEPSELFALMNDSEHVPNGIVDAFQNYEIKSILWSERDEAIEALAA